MRLPYALPVAAAIAVALTLPIPAAAADSVGTALAVPDQAAAAAAESGGAIAPAEPAEKRSGARRKKRVTRPDSARGARQRRVTLLTDFELRRKRLFLLGRAARVEFTLSGRRAARVRLHVLNAGDR